MFKLLTETHMTGSAVFRSEITRQCQSERCTKGKGKGVYSSLWIGNPSQSYGAPPAIWDHTVLPATRHKWMHPP